jgi:hypothetical protein
LLRLHHYGFGYLAARVGRAAMRSAVCLATGDKNGARQRYSWATGSLRGFLAHTKPTHQSNRPDRTIERPPGILGENTSAHN